MLPNVPYFPFAFFGMLRLGAVVVPMNPLLKDREVAFYLRDSGAKALLAWHQFAEAAVAAAEQAGAECMLVEPGQFEQLLAGAAPVQEVVDRDDDATALILCTSGTPKGAQLTHGNLRAATQVSVEVAAVVSLNEGADASPNELRDYVKQRVAVYKYPRTVLVLDDLPKTPTGKILKREIEVPGGDRPG